VPPTLFFAEPIGRPEFDKRPVFCDKRYGFSAKMPPSATKRGQLIGGLLAFCMPPTD
jgi:hypothetical protein